MRTFLALCTSVGTTRRIAEAMEREAVRLKELGWKLAWVPPANLHVTMKFLGDVQPEAIDAIAARLRRRCADLPPVTLRAKGYGLFATDGAPKVLWVGVEGGKPLEAMQRSLESDMVDLGFAAADKPFHPHITVARVVEPRADVELAWSSDADFGEDKIPEIVLYESRVYESRAIRAGAEYVARARVPFSKPR